jgi:hypothetical protein
LGNDGKYLYRNTIELIEATPNTRLSKTCEQSSKRGDVIRTGTVLDNNEQSHILTKILDSFGFTSTGGSLRSTTSEHIKS